MLKRALVAKFVALDPNAYAVRGVDTYWALDKKYQFRRCEIVTDGEEYNDARG